MEFINKNPKIYIISGKAKSGKDTVADIICNNYKNMKCKKLAYAYYLKEYVKSITNWDGNESTKPRDLLQEIGIDLIKNKIDDKLLINRVVEDIKFYSYFYDVIIITDARLVDEIEIPKRECKNVTTIRINSKNDNNLTVIQKQHITETDLDNYENFDYIIKNSDNYDKLVDDVKKILEEVDING